MKKILVQTSNWKFIVPVFLCAAYCIYSFQVAQDQMSEICGHKVEMLDVRQGYSLEEINLFFTELQSEGREIHRRSTSITDSIFAIANVLLFILIYAFFLRKITHQNSNWLYLSLLPLILMVSDFMENFNTIRLLDSFPELDSASVQYASQITSTKLFLVDIALGLLLLLGIIFLLKWGLSKLRNN
ncbi:MAG: hypothetical protein AAFN93_23390 [Bacteroidota bacterium]